MDIPVVSPLRAKGPIRAKQDELALGFVMEINVVRSERKPCPSCGARRVLYHLAAWVKGQPAGSGRALCARCAGFRAGSRGG